MFKRPKFLKKSLATYHPWLYHIVVFVKRVERHVEWQFDGRNYAETRQEKVLDFRVKKHQSVLIRRYSNNSDMELQYNKVGNLKLVIEALNGTIIRPNETFSFYKLLGKPTEKRGFKRGMELSRGEARAGFGGGICQSSNLIYWLALHSPLETLERHHHSFDPFPDTGRVLPFASGATVMYNYRDLCLYNPTEQTFQLRLWLDEKCLNGELRTDVEMDLKYHVYEKEHYFEKKNEQYFRSNELWREVKSKGREISYLEEEFLVRNYAEVKYVPDEFKK
ncbi:MAG: Vancomycin B-type resistance protein VanW [uncultured Sulfurovum sp.]|uniref:Vancomycin B-type resistance protein VanW n=1 Tax=uncultured Sulfurovum sp. TaxID=269237 RepID=A0A6S6TAY5_9BACT|nr:MAG: Vancomycin B-type resistance protein VanW [uncultured Sulfurovum sp.]